MAVGEHGTPSALLLHSSLASLKTRKETAKHGFIKTAWWLQLSRLESDPYVPDENQKMSRESSDDVLLHEVLQHEPPREIATSSRKLIF